MSGVDFTAAQREAIDIGQRHRDACVVAGPGSGKTTVLVEYFRLLVAAGVDPLRILAITFTEKAAGNMRSRLAAAFRGDPDLRARLERAWVSTVHGFCARLLRENAVFAGVDPEFSVADERESWRMQQEAMAAALSGLLAEQPAPMRALIRGLSSYEFEEAVLSAYDAMRGAGMRVDEVAAVPPPPAGAVADIAETAAGHPPRRAHHLESYAARATGGGARRRGANRHGQRSAAGAAGHRGLRRAISPNASAATTPTTC